MNSIPPADEKSPCINVCRLDLTGVFCEGCGRTRAEIARWMDASRAEKIEIKQNAAARLKTKTL